MRRALLRHPHAGDPSHLRALGGPDPLERISRPTTARSPSDERLHFTEHERPVPYRNKIDLPLARPVVALDDPIPLLLEVPDSYALTTPPNRSTSIDRHGCDATR